jgi:hypothetical protein
MAERLGHDLPQAQQAGAWAALRQPAGPDMTRQRPAFRPRNREDAIQRAVFEHLRVSGERGYAFHPANGGWRSPIEAAILKGLGVRAGVPDVIAIKGGQVYALEIKTENSRASDAQLQAIDDIRAAGTHAEICHGLAAAINQLEQWKRLRGQAQ